MQRMYNLDKWSRLEENHVANFESTLPRRVRLDVNAPFPVRLYVHDTEGVSTFLALVHGRDVLEFAVSGEFGVGVEGGDVWLHTIDGEDFSFAIPDAVTFTKLVERRTRNPEVEMMRYQMERNMNAIIENQAVQLERLLDQRERASAARAAQSAPPGDDDAGGKKSQPAKSAAADAGDKPGDAGDAGDQKP